MLKKWLDSLTAEDIMLKPLKKTTDSLSVAKAKDKLLQENLAGLIINDAQGNTKAACSKMSLLNCSNDSVLVENIYSFTNFLEIKASTPLHELITMHIQTESNHLLIKDKSGNIEGIIYWPYFCRWLWKQLSLTATRLSSVLDTVNEAITIIDQDNSVVGWNRRAEKLYNISSQEICGKNIDMFFTHLVVTRVMKENREVHNAYHQPREGTHVLINSKPIYLRGELIGSVSSERDITEIVYLHQDLSRANTQVQILKQEIEKISDLKDPFQRIIGHSKKLSDAISIARRVASTNAAVLIRGESGTGKELFAEAIHLDSPRRDKALIAINCGAIPHTLFESELFGYKAGAFTGADRKGKPGKFELADGGTLFLDEIGELHPDMQVKLLRVLQQNIFYRVGGNEPVKVDVRILASTNRNLEEMIFNGTFREDLYYRLNVVSLEVPPLRDRKEDIPELIYAFIQEFASIHNRDIHQVEPEVMSILLSYHWPGNIRELRNLVERLVILTESDTIKTQHIPKPFINTVPVSARVKDAATLTELTKFNERELIIKAIEQTNGNKAKAAKLLGIPRSTLYYKIKILELG